MRPQACWVSFLGLLLVLLLVQQQVSSLTTTTSCHPDCRWQCDDPSCPAVCHPVCAAPKCEMRCEETPCAKCVVHCQRPVCSIRCPKDTCEQDSCPKCEVVCAPPACHTTCTAPEPKCQPVCEELDCAHKCAKPTNCQRPKCELQCEKSACADTLVSAPCATKGCEVGDSNRHCCVCDQNTAQYAIAAANSRNSNNVSQMPKPSLLEVLDSFTYVRQTHSEPCCPCDIVIIQPPVGPTPTPPPMLGTVFQH